MDTRAVVKALGYLITTVVNIPSNLTVICAFMRTLLCEGKLMTADVILCNLALANLMVAFTRSIPQTMAAFGYKNLFDDIGCKLSIYCFRIFRGLSISLTSLLSTYQAVLISPATSKLAELKMKIPKYLPQIVFILFVVYAVNSADAINNIVSSVFNNTIPPYTYNMEYCFFITANFTAYLAVGMSKLLIDLVFIVVMSIMSVYILVVLHQHGKKVKSIRSSDSSKSKTSAETKASRAVVTLVILYDIFFGVDNVIWLYSQTIIRVAPLLIDIRIFFATLYASVCPIVVIITNPKVHGKLQLIKVEKAMPSQQSRGAVAEVS
ncbi:olfactory receptor class A-like protein 1 [Polypterus senegalus]